MELTGSMTKKMSSETTDGYDVCVNIVLMSLVRKMLCCCDTGLVAASQYVDCLANICWFDAFLQGTGLGCCVVCVVGVGCWGLGVRPVTALKAKPASSLCDEGVHAGGEQGVSVDWLWFSCNGFGFRGT